MLGSCTPSLEERLKDFLELVMCSLTLTNRLIRFGVYLLFFLWPHLFCYPLVKLTTSLFCSLRSYKMAAGRRLTLERNKLIWRLHLNFVFRKNHWEVSLKIPTEITPWELLSKEMCYVMKKPNTQVTFAYRSLIELLLVVLCLASSLLEGFALELIWLAENQRNEGHVWDLVCYIYLSPGPHMNCLLCRTCMLICLMVKLREV